VRRNYERDVKAGVCVRCHKRPATPTNKRCQRCQDGTLSRSDSVNEDLIATVIDLKPVKLSGIG